MPDFQENMAWLPREPSPAAAVADATPTGLPFDAAPLVAVCAVRPRPELIQSCLRSVTDDGAEPVVVIGRDDPQRSVAETVAESIGVPIVGASGQGLAALHNAALAICTSKALALLDDDVVVEPGWFEALTAAWARAPADVAAIGGPLRLRIVGAAPRWWRKEAEAAFATHDYGQSVVVLDPERQTMHCGNLSFRCDALRGAEGFWPACAQGDTRDWCSDEHSAQHALGGLGWRGLYEPRAIAHRTVHGGRISFRQVLERRFRSGSRAAIMGGARARAGALRRTCGSALELATAPTRSGERRRLMESSAELSANLGSLLAPLVAGRDFQPTGATPFRPFIPAARPGNFRQRASRLRASLRHNRAPVILLYHRVHPTADSGRECVSARHFEEHLAVLRERAEIVSVATIAAWARRRFSARRQPNTVAITFDDGYVDNLTYAAPLLDAFSAPATVFVTTAHVESQEPFFWDEIESLLSRSECAPKPLLELAFAGHARAWLMRAAHERTATGEILRRLLQALTPSERVRALEQLRCWAGSTARTTAAEPDRRPMSVCDLQSLAEMPSIDIAAHTVHHVSLRFQTVETQRLELIRAREQLDAWLGISRDRGFAYPFGVPGVDFDEHTTRLVREHGYAYAVSNEQGIVTRRSSTYALPRLAVPDVDGAGFSRWLDSVS